MRALSEDSTLAVRNRIRFSEGLATRTRCPFAESRSHTIDLTRYTVTRGLPANVFTKSLALSLGFTLRAPERSLGDAQTLVTTLLVARANGPRLFIKAFSFAWDAVARCCVRLVSVAIESSTCLLLRNLAHHELLPIIPTSAAARALRLPLGKLTVPFASLSVARDDLDGATAFHKRIQPHCFAHLARKGPRLRLLTCPTFFGARAIVPPFRLHAPDLARLKVA